ncbi:MAG: SHOCT domain-containing protein [Phycisphaerae bacterium]|nr:SHOCT domain-containing protein [Phycisphaerae bacterium]
MTPAPGPALRSMLLAVQPGSVETSRATDVFMQVLPYAAVILALTLIGGIIMMISRRKIDSSGGGAPVGFTLSDLKELRDRGELSDEEFERARQDVIARARKAFRRDGNDPPVR